MTVKLPGALWVPINRNYTARKRSKTDCVILHVAVSEAKSLAGWFNNPSAGASSHFYVRRDGTIEQYIDLDYISWANGAGNSRSITVETQGGASGEWTAAQHVANVKIIVFAHQKYGVPIVQMTNSKSTSKGVGYHLLGVPANRTQKLLKRSQTGGELWSSAVGKVCPGPERVKQIPSIVAEAKRKATGVVKPTSPSKPVPKPSNTPSKAVQDKLKGMGFPRQGVAEVKAFQKQHNLVEDGDWGSITEAKYQYNVRLQNALKKMKGVPKTGWKSDGYIGTTSNKWKNYTLKRQGWTNANLEANLKRVGAW